MTGRNGTTATMVSRRRVRLGERLGRADKSPLGIWFWELDRVLLGLFVVLTAIGLIAVQAASPATAARLSTAQETLDPLHFFFQQLQWVLIGFPVLLIVSMMRRDQARRFAIISFCGVMGLMLLVPVMGKEVNGAVRWIGFGPLGIQPSEFLKPFYAVTLAWILSLKLKDPKLPVVALSIFVTLLIGLLLMLQPDLGQTIIFCGIWLVLMAVAGLSLRMIFSLAAGGIGGVILAYFFYPVATQRIDAWLSGGEANDHLDLAYRTLTASGAIGVGPGLGTMKYKLPEAHTDYIFSVIGEEFGLLACAAIALLFLALLVRVILRLLDEEDVFTILAVTGLATQFGGQAIINMAVNLQLFPSKGMTLPFISYGGSSFIALSIGAGLLLALTRRNPYLDRPRYIPKGRMQ